MRTGAFILPIPVAVIEQLPKFLQKEEDEAKVENSRSQKVLSNDPTNSVIR